jgi:uncharacterized NAD(P)/FAD-binding protein YdhS
MHGLGRTDGPALHVAVVGGGASGTLTAVQLLLRSAAGQLPLRVTLIDRYGRHGLGQAYSTSHPAHLLNAMAGQMSALPDDPDHLIRWAAAGQGSGTRAEPGTVTAATFLPRTAYGRYLRDTLAGAERQALPAARLTRVTAEVVAIRRNGAGPRLRLTLADSACDGRAAENHAAGGQLDADVVVLATGNAPAALPFAAPASDRIITDPWLPGALDGAIAGAGAGEAVVIAGTGLTMIDLAVALTAGQRGAIVHAVSRHGLLPRSHPGVGTQGRQLWLPVISRTTGPVRLAELMWQVRAATAASPANWPAVIDALRPYVPGLWRRMPDHDKRLFLRHVARYWEVHRHLVPPPTASRLTTLRATRQLSVHRGQIIGVVHDTGRLRISVGTEAGPVEIDAGWVINATGTTASMTRTATALLSDLLATGQARPDPLGLGIDASANGAVLDAAGRPSEVLHTLGPPLRGLWYETTAIPEIRDQAAALARRITSDSSLSQRRPGSAA